MALPHPRLDRRHGVHGEDLTPEERLADAATEEARTAADESGLPNAEAIGEIGDPADAIVRAAEESDADVIVLGTRERGWFDRLIHPSVSKYVVRHADIPVLVVPSRSRQPSAG